MTTNTQKTSFELDDEAVAFTVAAFVQTAHAAKISRDTAAKTAAAKASDQNIINKAHELTGKLLVAVLDARGPVAAMELHAQADELWHGLVGEMPSENKETTEAAA